MYETEIDRRLNEMKLFKKYRKYRVLGGWKSCNLLQHREAETKVNGYYSNSISKQRDANNLRELVSICI